MDLPRESLYWTPDYLAATSLPDPRAGIGDPIPLGMRLRRATPGDPVGPTVTIPTSGVVGQLPRLDDALAFVVQVLGVAIRYTLDGTAPSANNGFRAAVNDVLELTGPPTWHVWQHASESGAAGSLIAQAYM